MTYTVLSGTLNPIVYHTVPYHTIPYHTCIEHQGSDIFMRQLPPRGEPRSTQFLFQREYRHPAWECRHVVSRQWCEQKQILICVQGTRPRPK